MKKRGIGISSIGYPTGFFGGGDPNQAEISLKMDGTFDLVMGTSDLGQGCKTAYRQMAAEALDVPVESIVLTNSDTDTTPLCMGAFASRTTFIGGRAILAACEDLKQKMREFAAPMLEVEPENLEVAENKVYVKNNQEKHIQMADLGAASTFGGAYLVGIGAYKPDGPAEPDPETGEMPLISAVAFAACIVEVEVDTETGVVEVLKSTHTYEIGRAINLLVCKGQINGGTAMGIGMALTESAHPYWPSIDFAADTLGDYVISTAADMPKEDTFEIIEVPHPEGPYGAKGFCEMSSNAQIPAITAAIHDAIGVWITEFPTTPEMVLRALEDRKQAA